jgi:hypothetical protein
VPGVRHAGSRRRGRLSRVRRLPRTRDRGVVSANARGRLRPSEGDRTRQASAGRRAGDSLKRGKRAVLLGLRTARSRGRTRRRLTSEPPDAACGLDGARWSVKGDGPA